MIGRIAIATLAAGLLCAQEPADLNPDAGKKLFQAHCGPCHGFDATGGRGPNLAVPKFKRAADDQGLIEIARNGIPGTVMDGAWQLSDVELSRVIAYVRGVGRTAKETLPGDVGRGQAIYAKQGCSGCHIKAGEGQSMGPELTAIGAQRSAAYLREAIVKPEAVVPEGYLLVRARTRDGKVIQGIRCNEDSFTVQLKDASGTYHSFRKADLAEYERLAGKSAMPAYRLNAAELDDLVAYLASSRGDQ